MIIPALRASFDFPGSHPDVTAGLLHGGASRLKSAKPIRLNKVRARPVSINMLPRYGFQETT